MVKDCVGHKKKSNLNYIVKFTKLNKCQKKKKETSSISVFFFFFFFHIHGLLEAKLDPNVGIISGSKNHYVI